MAEGLHRPVLINEVLDLLNCSRKGIFVDATVGSGGHAFEILKRMGPAGFLIGIDRDPHAIKTARERLREFRERAIMHHGNYVDMGKILSDLHVNKVQGVLFDLGASSEQLISPTRGFSFQHRAPLDMRYNDQDPLTAYDIVNSFSEEELADTLWRYGEERRSRAIAREIVQYRKGNSIETTAELTNIILRAVPIKDPRPKIHPATRTFQALRIKTNNELLYIERGLKEAIKWLEPQGRLLAISFHSLEDRIVKRTQKEFERGCSCPGDLPVCVCHMEKALRILTKKPIRPGPDEIRANPRSRSAKLRAAERI